MNSRRLSGRAVAIAAFFSVPSAALAQSVSIELVEARSITLGRVTESSQPSSAAEGDGTSAAQSGDASAQPSHSGAQQRTALREATRAVHHGAMDRRSAMRDDTRMSKATAAGSARRQSEVAEHRQQRRGATQAGPANAGGNGKGGSAR